MQRRTWNEGIHRVWFWALLALSLAACGGDDSTEEANTAAPTAGGSTSSPPSPGGSAPPSITGSPVKVIAVGERYVFNASATDPDGDRLTFSIIEKPAWLNFSASKGSLIGTPGAADVGIHRGISIQVFDGRNVASLPSFDIDVQAIGSRAMTLSWRAPTENENGSPLMDLAGYEIVYGRQPRMYSHRVKLPNPGVTSYVVSGLVPGAYYFAMAAYNDLDVRSRFSAELAVNIQ